MPDFGMPTRNATQDANQGVVNPPTKKYVNRQQATVQKELTSLDTGVQSLGGAIGNALVTKLGEEAQAINERRAVQAVARQGQDKAINDIDKDKKRTGWTKGLFGQNVEYRAAQQRAVQTNVQKLYNRELSSMDTRAGESPDEYSERLSNGLEKELEKFKDDKGTRDLITQAWLTKSAKLANKHYEVNYAWNQQQQRDTFADSIRATFDQFTIESSRVTNPEDALELTQQARAVFNGDTKPEGMDDLAWRNVMNEEINNSLRSGNIGMYNAAKANGWLKDKDGSKLSHAERVKLDQALSAYDTDFGNDVSTLYEEAELEALQAENLDQAAGAYHALLDSIDAISSRSTLSPKANLILARATTKAQKGINSIEEARRKAQEEADKIGIKAVKEADKFYQKLDRVERVKNALRLKNPNDQSGAIEDIPNLKDKELEEALDLNIIEDISRITGSEQLLTEGEAIKVIMTDAKVAKSIAMSMKDTPVKSGLVKRSLETFINGWHNLTDEDHKLNAEGVASMNAVAQFAQGVKGFKSMVGNSNFDKYEILRRGLAVGQTQEMIQRDIQKYEEAEGNRGAYAITWQTPDGTNRAQYIQNLVKDFVGQKPYGESLAYYQEDFDRALTIYKGDMSMARDYLRTTAQDATVTYKGIAIPNAKFLNEIDPEYSFKTLMDEAQRSVGNEPSTLTPFLSLLGVEVESDDGTMLQRVDQVPDVHMYTVDGIEGVYLDAPKAQQPILLTSSTLKHFAQIARDRKEYEETNNVMSDEAAQKWLDEQKELRETQPLTMF